MTFSRSGFVTACLTLAVSGVPAEAQEAAGRGATIKPLWVYADRSLPKIPLPHFDGERYEAKVPDTLELAERAELAIHGITEIPRWACSEAGRYVSRNHSRTTV